MGVSPKEYKVKESFGVHILGKNIEYRVEIQDDVFV